MPLSEDRIAGIRARLAAFDYTCGEPGCDAGTAPTDLADLVTAYEEVVGLLREARAELAADMEGRDCAGCHTPWAEIQGHDPECPLATFVRRLDVALEGQGEAGGVV